MRRFLQVLLGVLVVVALSATVQATTIGQTSGATDPATEGFTLDGTAGTGVSDGGTAAWKMDAAWGRYKMAISSAQATDMSTNGWVAQETVRMGVAGMDPSASGVNSGYPIDDALVGLGTMEVSPTASGSGIYSVCLGTNASDNPRFGSSMKPRRALLHTGWQRYRHGLLHLPIGACARGWYCGTVCRQYPVCRAHSDFRLRCAAIPDRQHSHAATTWIQLACTSPERVCRRAYQRRNPRNCAVSCRPDRPSGLCFAQAQVSKQGNVGRIS